MRPLHCALSLSVAALLFLPACSKAPVAKNPESQVPAILASIVTKTVAPQAVTPTKPQATESNLAEQRHAFVRDQLEMQARQAAWVQAQQANQAWMNAQRQQAAQAMMHAQRQQAENQARAAGRQKANRAQRDFGQHTAGYLGSLGL